MAKDPTPAAAAPAESPPETSAPAPEAQAPASKPATAAQEPEKSVYLRLRTSEGYGARGGFSDLTETEAKAGVTSGVLRLATADEIARRRS